MRIQRREQPRQPDAIARHPNPKARLGACNIAYQGYRSVCWYTGLDKFNIIEGGS